MNKEAIFICQTPLHVLCASIIANKKRIRMQVEKL